MGERTNTLTLEPVVVGGIEPDRSPATEEEHCHSGDSAALMTICCDGGIAAPATRDEALACDGRSLEGTTTNAL